MSYSEKTIRRYLKVRALARGGTDGEKEAAKKILASLEEKNPGLKEEVDRSAQDPEDDQRRKSPPPHTSGPKRSNGNWENIFRYAQAAYTTIHNVAETISDAQRGRDLAEMVEMAWKQRSNTLIIETRIPLPILSEAQAANLLQKEAFRQALHSDLDEYLDALLPD